MDGAQQSLKPLSSCHPFKSPVTGGIDHPARHNSAVATHSRLERFIEISDSKATPIRRSPRAFQLVLGSASGQILVLGAIGTSQSVALPKYKTGPRFYTKGGNNQCREIH